MPNAALTRQRLRPHPGLRRGFTIIEVVMTMLIVGVLAAVALPSFESAMRKSRRADAISALAIAQQAQERWRSNRANYTTDLTSAPTGTPGGLGLASTSSASGYYGLSASIEGGGATIYVLAATATAGGAQESDTQCKVMAVRASGGNMRYGGGGTLAGIDWTGANSDPNRCWAR
jgi:type IV pilus assembly protein PilE